MTTTTPHIAESTHWYALDGSPAYEVQGANGMRATTLRDARKLNLFPSVTTIIRVAAAPGLERWKQEQVLHAALTLPRIENEPESALLKRIWEDSRQQGKDAAERGTALHASLQGHYEGKPPPADHLPHVKGATLALEEWMPEYGLDIAAERSFAHDLGFGGKVDLSGSLCVADFKTTEKDLETIKTWDEHAMQLAAYREGLKRPHAHCAIVYVSVRVPGQAKVMELSESDLEKGWACFQALLAFWQAKNGYRPQA